MALNVTRLEYVGANLAFTGDREHPIQSGELYHFCRLLKLHLSHFLSISVVPVRNVRSSAQHQQIGVIGAPIQALHSRAVIELNNGGLRLS